MVRFANSHISILTHWLMKRYENQILSSPWLLHAIQRKKFPLRICNEWKQVRNKMQIYSHLLKKSSIENFIFCVALGKPFETVLETSVLHIHAKILTVTPLQFSTRTHPVIFKVNLIVFYSVFNFTVILNFRVMMQYSIACAIYRTA